MVGLEVHGVVVEAAAAAFKALQVQFSGVAEVAGQQQFQYQIKLVTMTKTETI